MREEKRHRKKNKKRRKLRKWPAFLLLLLAFFIWWHFFYAKLAPKRGVEAEKEALRDKITILILGGDSADADSGGRTDTIMLACLDLQDKKVSLMSIPRDSRVRIPGKQNRNKINSAYVFGGVDLTRQTVENLLSIPVDYYMLTDFGGFEQVVDILGGVEIDVEKKMQYHTYNSEIDLKPGLQVLNGKEALDYVRFRHDALADLNRVQRQQKFLLALAKEMKKPASWLKVPQILANLDDLLQTDLGQGQLIQIGATFLGLDAANVTMQTIPGATQTIDGVSYFLIDESRLSAALDVFLGAPAGTAAKLRAAATKKSANIKTDPAATQSNTDRSRNTSTAIAATADI